MSTYTVQSGDTLSAIASRNGMTVQQLISLNPQYASNPNLIRPGESVNLSGGASPSTNSLSMLGTSLQGGSSNLLQNPTPYQTSTPSTIQGNYTPNSVPAASVDYYRQLISTGQMDPQTAYAQLSAQIGKPADPGTASMGAYNNALASLKTQLFAPMTVDAGGKISNLNSDGTLSGQSTTVNKSVTGAQGTSSQSSYVTQGSPTKSATYQYGSPATGYFASYQAAVDASTQLLSGQKNNNVGTTPTVGNGGLPSTGDPNLDSIQGALSSYVTGQLAAGYAVNPNLQITPALVSQFLSQAHSQIDPKYQQILTSSLNDINSSLDALGKQYANDQADAQAQFQQGVANEREGASGNGTAFSGGRGLNESNMLAAQNRTLGSLDTRYGQQLGSTLRAGANLVGNGTNNNGLSGSTNSFNIPNLTSQTASLEGPRGGSVIGGGLNTFYSPSDYNYGSIGSNFASDLTNQSNQFLSDYLKSASNNSARSFQNINGTPTLM